MDSTYAYNRLYDFSRSIFLKTGFNDADADTATTVLLSADLRGVDSHGISRLTGYVRLCEAGRIDPKGSPEIIHQTQSTGALDGKGGLGLIVAPYAMKLAIEKASAVGSGWISVQNSSHFGIAGVHAMMALAHDMIGIVMTNASPTVAPTFSIDKLLGTNPICVAVPAGKEAPFVADFATTTAANGKLELLQRKNLAAPNGWVQTKNGEPSTDAFELKNGGALLPLGGDREHGSHKGYMLGSIVDIFSGVLSGANYGPFVPPFPAYLPMPSIMPGKGIGHFFGAMRIDGFRPAAEFKSDMDNWISQFKNAKVANGFDRVVIPGEPEADMELERRQAGIPLHESVVKELSELGHKLGVRL